MQNKKEEVEMEYTHSDMPMGLGAAKEEVRINSFKLGLMKNRNIKIKEKIRKFQKEIAELTRIGTDKPKRKSQDRLNQCKQKQLKQPYNCEPLPSQDKGDIQFQPQYDQSGFNKTAHFSFLLGTQSTASMMRKELLEENEFIQPYMTEKQGQKSDKYFGFGPLELGSPNKSKDSLKLLSRNKENKVKRRSWFSSKDEQESESNERIITLSKSPNRRYFSPKQIKISPQKKLRQFFNEKKRGKVICTETDNNNNDSMIESPNHLGRSQQLSLTGRIKKNFKRCRSPSKNLSEKQSLIQQPSTTTPQLNKLAVEGHSMGKLHKGGNSTRSNSMGPLSKNVFSLKGNHSIGDIGEMEETHYFQVDQIQSMKLHCKQIQGNFDVKCEEEQIFT